MIPNATFTFGNPAPPSGGPFRSWLWQRQSFWRARRTHWRKRRQHQWRRRAPRQTSVRLRRARFRSFITIVTCIANPTCSKRGACWRPTPRAGRSICRYARCSKQMGATVSYDPSSQTATVTKPGATINVTVGKPEVIINGESRPLDVPPMIYHGVVLVPVRVISESMGAYVQWVSDRRLVVVRYIPATPPPTEAPPPPMPVETVAPPPPPPRRPIRSSWAATSVRITSRGRMHRIIRARSSTLRPAPNTTPTASIRRVGATGSRRTPNTIFPTAAGSSAARTSIPSLSTVRAS